MQPDRPVQTTLAFHASRIVIDVGVLMAMAAMSMTFVSAPGGNRSALAADALPAVLLLLPIFAVTLIPDHTRPLHPALGWASMVLALAALPYSFVKMIDAGVLADTLGGSVGFGPMLLLLGCIVTLAGIGIGIVRDLMGWPSGGTPQRSAAYGGTRGSRSTSGSRGESRRSAAAASPEAAAGARPSQATRVIEPTLPADPDEASTRIIARPIPAGADGPRPAPTESATPGAAPAPRPRPTPAPERPTERMMPAAPKAPAASQPEIVFPDTGAVAREAEPEPEPDDDDLMSTAERADAALTDHLLAMFDDDEIDENEQ